MKRRTIWFIVVAGLAYLAAGLVFGALAGQAAATLLLASLAIWPLITAIPAFIVAWIATISLARVTRVA